MAGAGDERRGMRRRSGRPGRRDLRDRSAGSAPGADLPLVHASSVFGAGEILRDGRLTTRRCPVFGRELVYFFVLRPDYRSRMGSEKSHQISRFPVVFILRPDCADPPFHVFPFDTGAAADGVFADQADPQIFLEDYELEPSLAAASAHVDWAFGTREGYWEARLRRDVLSGVAQFEQVTRGYVDVARMGRPGSNQHDRRASTVEVAVDRDVELAGNVLFAILPKQFLEDEGSVNAEVLDRLKQFGIPFETYDWRPNTAPDEFQVVIAGIARDYYARAGVL